MEDIFEKPSRADLGGGAPKPWKRKIQYAAGKTPEQFVSDGLTANLVEKGKLGFSYWSKELSTEVRLADCTLFHVHTFSQILGEVFDASGNKTEYWSNYVQDSRTEPFTVWCSRTKGSIAQGLYKDIGDTLPKGADFTIVFVVYEPVAEEMMVLALTHMLQQGIKESIAKALGMDAAKVYLFGMSESFWGFRLKGYTQVNKACEAYAGKGELFYVPVFDSGVLGAASPIRALVSEKRAAVAQWYESNKQKPQQAEADTAEKAPETTKDDLPF